MEQPGTVARAAVPAPTDTGNDDELVVLMIRATKAIVERLRSGRPGAESSPVTVMHGLAAHYLIDRDNVTAGELARYLRITKQSASEVVAVLEQAGIVRRDAHPHDRRARVLRLTDDGRAKLDAGRLRWQEVEDEWCTLVGRDQLDVVRTALETFLAADLPCAPTGSISGC